MASERVVRPQGFWTGNRFERGLEAAFVAGKLVELRPTVHKPDPVWISPPFANVHSHLEYRGFQSKIQSSNYWEWIRELTEMKASQDLDQVKADCILAAQENKATGVGLIGEHSDRPFSGAVLAGVGIRGKVFQEVITFLESDSPAEKLALVKKKMEGQRAEVLAAGGGLRLMLAPHALYTVDKATLASFQPGAPSIHLAESPVENEYFESGTGPIAELYAKFQVQRNLSNRSAVREAVDIGVVGSGTQCVHCCAVSNDDIELLAQVGAVIAHCPRSNIALGCPPAPIEEMLATGLKIGIGMDSPASSGEIDFFAEMRAVTGVSADKIWEMGTTMGAATLGFSDWGVYDSEEAADQPYIKIQSPALTVQELIEFGNPAQVEWL